jgi:hypothetical protein
LLSSHLLSYAEYCLVQSCFMVADSLTFLFCLAWLSHYNLCPCSSTFSSNCFIVACFLSFPNWLSVSYVQLHASLYIFIPKHLCFLGIYYSKINCLLKSTIILSTAECPGAQYIAHASFIKPNMSQFP